MPTRDEVQAMVINLLGTDAHLSTTEVAALIQARFDHIVDLSWWSRRRKDFTVRTVAQVASSSDTSAVDYVTNGAMERWDAGATVAPTSWIAQGAGGTIAKATASTNVYAGGAAAAVARVGADVQIYQDITALYAVTFFQGKTITATARVRATVAARAFVAVWDGLTTTYSSLHSGGGAFELLTVSATIAAAAPLVRVAVGLLGGDTTAYFDAVTLTVKTTGVNDLVTPVAGASAVMSSGVPFTSGMAGRAIQIGEIPQYFFINAVTDSTTIVLGDGEGNAVTWPGASATAQPWRVFQTLYALPSDAQDVVSLAGPSVALDEISGGRAALDRADPYRVVTNAIPTAWCTAGENSSGVREVEIYPAPTTGTLLRGQYIQGTQTLSGSTVITVPSHVLVWGVASDACGLLAAKEGSEAWARLQGFYEGKYTAALDNADWMDKARRSLPSTWSRRAVRAGVSDWDVSHMETP